MDLRELVCFPNLEIDPESSNKQRRRGLLKVQLLAIIICAAILLILVILLTPSGLVGTQTEWEYLIFGALAASLGAAFIYAINEKLSIDLAAILYLLFLIFLVAVSDTPQHVVNGRALFLFSLPITAASFTFRPWASFATATLSSMVLLGYAAFIGGVLPNIPGIMAFFILATVMWLSAETLNRALKNLSKTKEELESQRNRALFYLDLIGHDITNKLQAILMATEVLRSTDGTVSVAAITDLIEDTVEECASLSNQVRKTHNLYSTKLQKLLLVDEIKASLRLFESEYPDADVVTDFEIDQPYVQADEFLQELFLILLRNAAQHAERDTVTVWVNATELDSQFRVSVADNGRGIPDERKRHLFDSERRYGGVGLHVAKQIVTKYDGAIDITDRIEGNPSAGAKFNIYLPRWQNQQE
ncbi:MAG: hypothetical protein GF309_01145 [Candidatus Lokiarchaeota archaeon]|nr:hypothetical protein [Candidatus Lokiarchaeota archaeon]